MTKASGGLTCYDYITRVYHVVDKKGGAREVDLVGFRRLFSLLLELDLGIARDVSVRARCQ